MTALTTQTNEAPRPIDVEPALLSGWLDAGDTVLIDVREPFEHAAERIDGAVHIPLGELDAPAIHKQHAGKRVVFHCAGGKRSAKACAKLAACADGPTYHLAGGIEAWKQAGQATVKPQTSGAIPVMRQVQITAGSLVVIGLALGWFVNPAFLLLSAFIGCGLVFAGVSGWCGMAKLLAVMPWNK